MKRPAAPRRETPERPMAEKHEWADAHRTYRVLRDSGFLQGASYGATVLLTELLRVVAERDQALDLLPSEAGAEAQFDRLAALEIEAEIAAAEARGAAAAREAIAKGLEDEARGHDTDAGIRYEDADAAKILRATAARVRAGDLG